MPNDLPTSTAGAAWTGCDQGRPQIQGPCSLPGREGRGLGEKGRKERWRAGRRRKGQCSEPAHSQWGEESAPSACPPVPLPVPRLPKCVCQAGGSSVCRRCPSLAEPSESPAELQTVGAGLRRWAQNPRWAPSSASPHRAGAHAGSLSLAAPRGRGSAVPEALGALWPETQVRGATGPACSG